MEAGHDTMEAGHDTMEAGHDTMEAGHDTMEAGHDTMGDRNGSRSVQNERGRHGQNIPKQPLRSVMQLSSYHYSRGHIRHSRNTPRHSPVPHVFPA